MVRQSENRTRDLWRSAYRMLASTRLALWLLAGLGMMMLVGTLLPQLSVQMDESTQAVWLAHAKHKYGSLFVPFRSLGLFGMFRSPAFLALVAALLVNTALCTTNRLRSLGRMIGQRRIGALGTLITHLAVITLLLSLAISSGYSFQENGVALAAGQTHPLGPNTELLVRSDDVHLRRDESGYPVEYAARVTVLQGEREGRSGLVKLNAPLRAFGFGIWLLSYHPGVRVQVLDEDGSPLILENTDGERSSGQATCNLSTGPGLLRVPEMGFAVHISAADGRADAAFHLQVQPSDAASPLVAETVESGLEVRAGDLRITLYPAPYAVYRLKRDPGAVPALLSALALAMGTSLSLFSSRVRTP
jgi:hypothetical protein